MVFVAPGIDAVSSVSVGVDDFSFISSNDFQDYYPPLINTTLQKCTLIFKSPIITKIPTRCTARCQVSRSGPVECESY